MRTNEIWQTSIEELGDPALLVDHECVYVSGTESVYALDQDTGQQRRTYSPEGVVSAPPMCDGRSLFVATVTAEGYPYDPSSVTAFETTGTERWQKESPSRVIDFAVTDDTLVYVHQDGAVAVATDTGEQRWTYPVADETPATPAGIESHGETVAIIGPNGVLGVNADSSRLSWQLDQSSVGPSECEEELFVAPGEVDTEETVSAIDCGSGRTHWVATIHWDGTGIAYDAETATVGVTGPGGTYGFDADDGTQAWLTEAHTREGMDIDAVDGTFYVGSMAGMAALDGDSGRETAYADVWDGIDAVSATSCAVYGISLSGDPAVYAFEL